VQAPAVERLAAADLPAQRLGVQIDPVVDEGDLDVRAQRLVARRGHGDVLDFVGEAVHAVEPAVRLQVALGAEGAGRLGARAGLDEALAVRHVDFARVDEDFPLWFGGIVGLFLVGLRHLGVAQGPVQSLLEVPDVLPDALGGFQSTFRVPDQVHVFELLQPLEPIRLAPSPQHGPVAAPSEVQLPHIWAGVEKRLRTEVGPAPVQSLDVESFQTLFDGLVAMRVFGVVHGYF
jgi:hypothetical protein